MMSRISQFLMAFGCLLLVLLAISLSWLRAGIDEHPSYHQWVEQEVSRTVGQALQIGAFQIKLVGTRLQISLLGIETKNSLSLARLDVGVNLLGSLQARQLRLSQVKAGGLGLTLSQQADGSWGPQSMAHSGSEALPQLIVALVAKGPQLFLNNLSLSLNPIMGEVVSLPNLNMQLQVVENKLDELTQISLSLQAVSGIKDQTFALQSLLTVDLKTGLAEDIKTFKNKPLSALSSFNSVQRAQVYVFSENIEIAPLVLSLVPENAPIHLDRLHLGGEYWLNYRASKQLQLVSKNAQIALNTSADKLGLSADLSTQLKADLTADINLNADFGTQATSAMQPVDWIFTAQGLSGQVNDLALPLSELQLRKTKQGIVVQTPKLHLAHTQAILNTFKSVPNKINLPIQSLAPSGWLHEAQLHLGMQQGKQFLLTGEMQNVSLKAWAGVPQITSADGKIWLNRYGGKVIINDTDGLGLQVKKLTSAPWKMRGLQGEFNWRYGALVNRFSSSNMQIDLDDGRVNLKMLAAFPRKGSDSESFMQLTLGAQGLDLGRLPGGLLPDLLLGTQLGSWLTLAAPKGTLIEAALIYNGRIGNLGKAASMARSMPVAAYIEAPVFTYHPDWPPIQGLKAQLNADHERVLIEADAGEVTHSQMTQVVKGWQVEVPIYQKAEQKRRYIQVHGQLAGEASQMMTAAQTLPVPLGLPSWLKALEPKGKVSVQGKLAIPFGHVSKVTYDLNLSANDLSGYWAPLKTELRQLELELELSSAQAGIGAITGRGLMDGQLVSFKRLSKLDLAQPWLSKVPNHILDDAKASLSVIKAAITLQFEGRLRPDYLATKSSQPWFNEISAPLPFVARWSSCPQAKADCRSLSAEVDLSQVDIKLPEPLHDLRQLELIGHWQDDQQNWYASMGNHQAAVKLAVQKNSTELMVLGANVAFQKAADWAQPGQWKLGGQLDFINVAPWWELYQKHIQPWGEVQGLGSKTAPLVLPEIDLKIKQATWLGLDIDQTTLTLKELKAADDKLTEQPWRLRLTSPQLAGKIDYFGTKHPLVVHIKHLHLSFEEVVAAEEGEDVLQNVDPSQFPDADIAIDELIKNGESFGQWQFKTRRQGAQVNVHDLDAYIRHSHLQGNLIWDRLDGIHHTQFTGRVEVSDMSSFLMAWGYDPALVAQTAAIEVQFKWPHSPLAFSIKDSSGDLGLRLKNGSFSATPNATKGLKILALLDMKRVIKRVKLDFSDIIEPGFSFDSIAAHYHFENGLGSTVSPLNLKSTALDLSMDGWIDFNRRQVENNLIVTLPVAGKLPLAALIAGLPQLSGMIYVVNKLIGDELATFTSARYSVLGSLDNPDVKLVKMFDKDYQPQSIKERIENVITFD